ncbi:hypothetical protein SAMN06297144_1611 [Sphingomonas guangdongensis]|uniref:Lipoprotein n=1 Tax=Sphingomonas guangdongensis TaxID=1141890 RepID=A0A285QX03_9SPHN|nr:hypothetical protein [Sphingomonas guangdongensis]SOB86505.1 hypothetical protein SAMN06297144_1611 [Sphingomonas guangdongensis]
MRSLSALSPAVLTLGALTLGGCIPRNAPPPPAPAAPRPVPRPVPAPPPPPASSDWRDWAITPGTWSYRAEGGGSVASFGLPGAAPVVSLRCDRANGQVVLARGGSAGSSLTVRTSTLTRALAAQGGVAQLPARDPLLDAIGFSRGRFVVEAPPLAPAAIPAWAEILRVVEDCR